MFDPQRLPEHYHSDDGSMIAEPVYLLHAECFLGKYGAGALYEPGTELVYDQVPNEHMAPLNRAAGERYQEWMNSLPGVGGQLSQEDIAEAAKLMARKDGDEELPHELWWAGVIKLAARLKQERAGRTIPAPKQDPVRPLNGRMPPPMTAGEFKDVAHRGDPNAGVQRMEPAGGRRVRRAPPAMTQQPRPPTSDAVGQPTS